MIVFDTVMVEFIFENWQDTLFVNLLYGGRAASPFFVH